MSLAVQGIDVFEGPPGLVLVLNHLLALVLAANKLIARQLIPSTAALPLWSKSGPVASCFRAAVNCR